jgi:hypothetical protein
MELKTNVLVLLILTEVQHLGDLICKSRLRNLKSKQLKIYQYQTYTRVKKKKLKHTIN